MSNTPNRQNGAVLIVSIVLLVVLSLIGLYLFNSSLLEMRMADNAASSNIAFQRAEAARAYAEGLMNDLADKMSKGTLTYGCGTKGYYARASLNINGCTALNPANMKWDANDSFAVPNKSNQRYALEYLGIDTVKEIYLGIETGNDTNQTMQVYVFRILAHGTEDAGGNTVLQSIFTARKSS